MRVSTSLGWLPTRQAAAVTTLAAANISATTVMLRGTVNANGGGAGAVSSDYGTTTAYGSNVPALPRP